LVLNPVLVDRGGIQGDRLVHGNLFFRSVILIRSDSVGHLAVDVPASFGCMSSDI